VGQSQARGAAGKTVIAGAVESGDGKGKKRRLGRVRLSVVADASSKSLGDFLDRNVAKPGEAKPGEIATDAWSGYGNIGAAGFEHPPINLSAAWGEASLRLPAIHLVFGLAKRWLLGTHHGAVRPRHLQAYLDEFVFRFNRRTAKSIAHRFARRVENAVQVGPTTHAKVIEEVVAA
jgi:transposase-like protein